MVSNAGTLRAKENPPLLVGAGGCGSPVLPGPLLRAWGRSPMWVGKYDNKGKAVGDGRLRFQILNQRQFRLHDRPLKDGIPIGIPFLTFMLHRGSLFKPK